MESNLVFIEPILPLPLYERQRIFALLLLPEGANENSPGCSPRERTEPWERRHSVPAPPRRAGRTSPPNVPGDVQCFGRPSGTELPSGLRSPRVSLLFTLGYFRLLPLGAAAFRGRQIAVTSFMGIPT